MTDILKKLQETREKRLARTYEYVSDYYDFPFSFRKVAPQVLQDCAALTKDYEKPGLASMCALIAVSLGTEKEKLSDVIGGFIVEPDGEILAMAEFILKISKLPNVFEALREKMLKDLTR